MIVVSNASPLLALAQADRLSILKALFEYLLIPEAVRRETVDQCRVPEQRQRIEAAIGDFIFVGTPAKVHGFSRNLG
jgi:predicted nucleic acid-binding protein